ncbi:MAG: DMT family transporter [Chloroflexi bacterium]|nr:MAG: DMT family transporter [Chloroflexota bacterium]TMG35900.1 MAG: DMT family transporter [Chloroflexota bacterium]TMG36505.1 MAG: DMT family transporter [Chloroflexota bacterium]
MTQSIACVSAFDLLLLVLLGAIWGASFLFIRVAAPVLGPIPLMDLRVIVAAAALLLYSAARRRNPLLPHRWRDFVVLGTLNNAIPFVTIATAELVLTASLGAILNATSPFFTVIVAAIWARARPSAAQVAGTVIGFAGVAVLTGVGSLELGPGVLGGIALALVGAFSYAVAAVYTGRTFLRLPPISLAVNQLIVSGTILLLPAIATRTAAPLDPAALASAVALALLGTSVGYLIYFRLIERTGPTRAITVTLLIPIFGVLLGHLVLGEPVGPGLLAGLALILLGVSLVNGLLPAGRRVHVPTTGAGAASD